MAAAVAARSQPKYFVIADEMRAAIADGTLKVDALLPSQNDLMKRYGVSVTTVRKSIDLLVEGGWVRTARGKGIFAQNPHGQPAVDRPDGGPVGCVMVGSFPRSDRFSQILLSGAVSVVEPQGHEIRFTGLPVNDQLIPRLREFRAGLYGLLLCGEIRDDVLRMLKETQTRCVVIGHTNEPNALLDEFHRVLYDTDMAGYLAAQSLAMQGHKRVAFAYALDIDRTREIRQGFARGCRDHLLQAVDVRVEAGEGLGERVVEQIVRAGDVDGLTIQGEPAAAEVVAALRARQLDVPAERSVVVITGLPADDYPEINVNRVEFNLEAWGREAAALLLSGTAAVVHKRIPVRFKPASGFASPPPPASAG
jgi:hypothetical protein